MYCYYLLIRLDKNKQNKNWRLELAKSGLITATTGFFSTDMNLVSWGRRTEVLGEVRAHRVMCSSQGHWSPLVLPCPRRAMAWHSLDHMWSQFATRRLETPSHTNMGSWGVRETEHKGSSPETRRWMNGSISLIISSLCPPCFLLQCAYELISLSYNIVHFRNFRID
jgi:hypothetical protein